MQDYKRFIDEIHHLDLRTKQLFVKDGIILDGDYFNTTLYPPETTPAPDLPGHLSTFYDLDHYNQDQAVDNYNDLLNRLRERAQSDLLLLTDEQLKRMLSDLEVKSERMNTIIAESVELIKAFTDSSFDNLASLERRLLNAFTIDNRPQASFECKSAYNLGDAIMLKKGHLSELIDSVSQTLKNNLISTTPPNLNNAVENIKQLTNTLTHYPALDQLLKLQSTPKHLTKYIPDYHVAFALFDERYPNEKGVDKWKKICKGYSIAFTEFEREFKQQLVTLVTDRESRVAYLKRIFDELYCGPSRFQKSEELTGYLRSDEFKALRPQLDINLWNELDEIAYAIEQSSAYGSSVGHLIERQLQIEDIPLKFEGWYDIAKQEEQLGNNAEDKPISPEPEQSNKTHTEQKDNPNLSKRVGYITTALTDEEEKAFRKDHDEDAARPLRHRKYLNVNMGFMHSFMEHFDEGIQAHLDYPEKSKFLFSLRLANNGLADNRAKSIFLQQVKNRIKLIIIEKEKTFSIISVNDSHLLSLLIDEVDSLIHKVSTPAQSNPASKSTVPDVFITPESRPAIHNALKSYVDELQRPTLLNFIMEGIAPDSPITLNCQQNVLGAIIYRFIKSRQINVGAIKGSKWLCEYFRRNESGVIVELSQSTLENHLKGKSLPKP